MADTSDLMTIGQFSSLARLSVRMLRHYDEHAVLIPADVDETTGHRRYASRQLADAGVVRRLRDVGFGVSAIGALLAARDTDAYAHALAAQRATLVDELRAAQQRLSTLEAMIDETETPMSITITTGTLPAMTVVTLRGTIPAYDQEGQLWERFTPEIARQGVRPLGPGGCIEHDATYVETDPEESVWLPVARGTRVEAPLEVFDLPEQRTVIATVRGPYAQITAAHQRIGEVMAAEGLAAAETEPAGLTGKVVNVYLTDPAATDEHELVTQVHRPIA